VLEGKKGIHDKGSKAMPAVSVIAGENDSSQKLEKSERKKVAELSSGE